MNRRNILSTILLVFISLLVSWGQCKEEASNGTVIINEISQGRLNTNEEFIELMVVGTGGYVNLNGYIIDDNNTADYVVGNESGHIRLINCFSDVAPGTLILIYNDLQPHTNIPASSENVMVIPFSDAHCISYWDRCPSNQYDGYEIFDPDGDGIGTPCQSLVVDGGIRDWKDYIPMRNRGDVIQIRDPETNLVHALSWGDIGPYAGSVYFNSALHVKSLILDGADDPTDVGSYRIESYDAATPGQYNSEENESWAVELDGASQYFDVISEVNPNDPQSIVITVENGVAPYAIASINPEINGITFSNNYHIIEGLECGTYAMNIIDGNGCTTTSVAEVFAQKQYQAFLMSELEKYQVPLTAECVKYEDCCIRWVPEEGVSDPSIINPTLHPESNQIYTLYFSDDDGNIKESYTFDINVHKDCSLITDPCSDEACNPQNGESITETLLKNGFRPVNGLSLEELQLPAARGDDTKRNEDDIISTIENAQVAYDGFHFALEDFVQEMITLLGSEGNSGGFITHQLGCEGNESSQFTGTSLSEFFNADKLNGNKDSYLWIYVDIESNLLYLKFKYSVVIPNNSLLDLYAFKSQLTREDILLHSQIISEYKYYVPGSGDFVLNIYILNLYGDFGMSFNDILSLQDFFLKCNQYFRNPNEIIEDEGSYQNCMCSAENSPDFPFVLGIYDGLVEEVENIKGFIDLTGEIRASWFPTYSAGGYSVINQTYFSEKGKSFRKKHIEGFKIFIEILNKDVLYDLLTQFWNEAKIYMEEIPNDNSPFGQYKRGKLAFLILTLYNPTKASKFSSIKEGADNIKDLILKKKTKELWDLMEGMLSGLSETLRKQFKLDFDELPEILVQFRKGILSVDTWKLALENFSTLWRKDEYFLRKLKSVFDYQFINGTKVKLPNIELKKTTLTKVSKEINDQVRNEFNNVVKPMFLKNLGNNSDISFMLKQAGISDADIPWMINNLKNGFGLPGYNVHHKIPIDLGGSNDFSNLVLMKKSPYHDAITSFQNSNIKLEVGQTANLDFPKVNGTFYSPPYIE